MSYWIELAYGMDGRGNDLQGEALKRRISPVALKESKLESAVLVQDPRGRWEDGFEIKKQDLRRCATSCVVRRPGQDRYSTDVMACSALFLLFTCLPPFSLYRLFQATARPCINSHAVGHNAIDMRLLLTCKFETVFLHKQVSRLQPQVLRNGNISQGR